MFFAVVSGFVVSALIPFMKIGKRRIAAWALASFPFCLTLFFAFKIPSIAHGSVLQYTHSWFSSLGISISFYLDAWSLIFALLICGIGTLVTLYSWEYLGDIAQRKRFFSYLFIFMASMLGTALSGNAILLFVFWELTSLSSYFLIGFNYEEERSRRNALQALLVTGAGGLAMLAGFVIIGNMMGTFEMIEWIKNGDLIRNNRLFAPALSLILLGAFTKSAQFPFHSWLPNAMVAPTPVSAYLHSSTMVKAGVYLLARLFPLFGMTEIWQTVLPFVGGITMITGIVMTLRVNDIKLHLAYITVSALGLLVLLIGTGTALSIYAAILFFVAHAFYKGSLFMVAGSIHHATGLRDPEKLSGLWRKMPVTAVSSVLAGASLASIPPLLGFTAKETALESIMKIPGSWVILAALLLASVVFTTMFLWVAVKPFIGKDQGLGCHEAPISMWLGGAALAILGFATYPIISSSFFSERAVSAISGVHSDLAHLKAHGNLYAFLLTMVSWVVGIFIYKKRLAVRTLLNNTGKIFQNLEPDHIYDSLIKGLVTVAKTQTNFFQSGSLRYYFRIMLVTMIVLCSAGFVRVGWPILHASPLYFLETVLALMIIASTVATLFTGERLAAIAYLGVVGLSISLIFFLFGAPDLAITQFAVEVLTLILLALVLYRLPHFKPFSSKRSVAIDAVIAIFSGLFVSIFVLYAASHKEGFVPSIARFYSENSEKLAHGKNIVNVILVDFRGFDTLGEITVLAIAGIGSYSLLKLILDSKKESK